MPDNLKEIEIKKFVLGPLKIICESKFMDLCTLPYSGHPGGCPNFDKKDYCPPRVKFFPEVYKDQAYIVVVGLNFKIYREMRKRQHPSWTERQLRNPLYWQGYLRKKLKDYTKEVLAKTTDNGRVIIANPEAMGVNLTETCRRGGLKLEWPPNNFVYKMYLIGGKREKLITDKG